TRSGRSSQNLELPALYIRSDISRRQSCFLNTLFSSSPAPGRLPGRHARARPSRVRTGPSLVARSQTRPDQRSLLPCSFAHRLLRKAAVAGLTVLAVAPRRTEQGGEVSFGTLSHKAAPVWKVCGAQSRSDCLRRQSVAPDEALARERRGVCTGPLRGPI